MPSARVILPREIHAATPRQVMLVDMRSQRNGRPLTDQSIDDSGSFECIALQPRVQFQNFVSRTPSWNTDRR